MFFKKKYLKILFIFLIYLIDNINCDNCGCSQVEGQHLQWNYFYAPFYHYFIAKQIVGYYKHWASEIMEHEISYNGSKVLSKLELIQVQDMSCDSKEVIYKKSAPTYDDNIVESANQTGDMLQLIDKLINVDKVKGLKDFKGVFEKFDEIKTVDYPDDTQLDFNWVSQKFLDFKKTYRCALGFSECVKQNEQKIKNFHFIIKVNLNFEGDGPEKKRSFFIVNRLVLLQAKGNLTYRFQPFFYQHTCNDSGIEDISYYQPEMNIFNGPSGHITTSQMIKTIQNLQVDNTYPNYQQIDAFVNTPILLNYFGFHDRPGVSEFRTSCIHALSSLRRSIEVYINFQFDPNYVIDYCPDPTVTYKRPNKKFFQTKIWEWLKDMYGGKMPPGKEKEKPEIKEIPKEKPEIKQKPKEKEKIEKKITTEKIILPKIDDLVPKYKPIFNEPKIQHIPPREIKKYQIYFLCEEFIYAIKSKLLEEEYEDLLFETGYIKFECDFLPPRQFNPSNIWTPENIQQEEFTSKGIIYYFQEEIGYFEFTRKPKSGDYEIYNLCFEAEIKFFTFFLSKQNCIEERIFDSQSLIEGQEALTVFSYHFGTTIVKFKRMIDEIRLISLGKLRYRDIIEIGKESFNLPQEDGINTGDFIFSYGVCKEEKPFFEYYEDTSSLEGYNGLTFYGYYQNLPHAPLQMTIQQSSEFHFFIEIDTGLQKAKFYYLSLLRLNRTQADDMKDDIEVKQKQLKEKLNKDNIDEKNKAELLDRSRIDTRKKYIAKLFKQEHLVELQSFITNTIHNQNGLTQFLATTAILKQQGKPNVVGEVNDAIQNGDLGKYMNTNIMNITLYSTLTNAIFMSLNYKRLDIQQDMFKLVTQKLPIQQIQEVDIENLDDKEKQDAINKHYENQCKHLVDIQFSTDYHSDYQLSQFGDWVFKETDKHLNKHVKEFILDVEQNFEETTLVYSVEQIANIITYDLNLGSFLYNSRKNNFFSFLYGIEEYSSKLVVNVYQFTYNLSNTYYIYFKTYYFSSQYLLTFGNQFEFINGLMNIINEVDNHFRLVAHKAMSTAFNCDKLSKDDIEQILDNVLEDLSQKQLVPDSICKVKDNLINNEFLLIKLNGDKINEIGEYNSTKICEDNPEIIEVMKFIELEDSYKIVVNETKGLINKTSKIVSFYL